MPASIVRAALSCDFLRVFALRFVGELRGGNLCGAHGCTSQIACRGPLHGPGCPLQVIHPPSGSPARLGDGHRAALDDREACAMSETKSREPSISAGRWLTLRQNGSGVSAAESEELKKMDFPSPPHTPLAGPNQGTKRPHTHKLKVALVY